MDGGQRPHNPKVEGSNPSPATNEIPGKSPPSREGSPVSGEASLLLSAVRRFVDFEVLDELWARNHLGEDQAMELAVTELRAMRSKHQA